MRIFTYNSLNLKKLRKNKSKVLLLIVPITILVALTVLVPSEVKNITNAVNQSFFGTVAQQSTLLELTKNSEVNTKSTGGATGSFSISSFGQKFSESDLETIKAISNVTAASINTSVPITNVKTTDLFADKSVALTNLTGIDSALAGLYSTENFEYTEGEAIPIILNANSFRENYEDWAGKDSVTVTLTRPTPGQNPTEQQSNTPIKSQAIDYSKESLIGKEITISFGGLSDLQDYTQSFSTSGITFTKKSAETLAAEEATRQSDISPYWDYTKISTPITYKFIVVGVIEDEGATTTYIPEAAANKIMKDYIQHQLDARTSTAIETSDLNSKFTGITFDGVEIQSTTFNVGGRLNRAIRVEGPGAGGVSVGGPTSFSASIDNDALASGTTYEIPGLVVETERSTDADSSQGFNPFASSGTVVGEYKSTDVYETSPKSGTTLLVKINDVTNRDQVVKDLNTKGFAYQDLQDTEVFANLKNSLNLVSIILAISFIVLSILIIIFNMGKFVADSTREIGILRAIGAKRATIRNIFLLQAVLYSTIAYMIGLALGLALVVLAAGPVAGWFDNVIGKSLRESFSVVQAVDASVFRGFDWNSIAVYTIVFGLIVFLVSLIPAVRASRISPVRAIKGE